MKVSPRRRLQSTAAGAALVLATTILVGGPAVAAAQPSPSQPASPSSGTGSGTVIHDASGNTVTTGTWYLLHDESRGGQTFGPRTIDAIDHHYDVALEDPNPGHKILFYENHQPSGTVVTTDRHFNIKDDSGTHHWWEEENGSSGGGGVPHEQYIDYTSDYDDSSNWYATPDGNTSFHIQYQGNDPSGYIGTDTGYDQARWATISDAGGDILQLTPVS